MFGLNSETHQRETGCLPGTQGSTQGLDWEKNKLIKRLFFSTGYLLLFKEVRSCQKFFREMLVWCSCQMDYNSEEMAAENIQYEKRDNGNWEPLTHRRGESCSSRRKALKNWVILFACTFPRAGWCSTRETKHWYKQQTGSFTGDSKICICNECHAVLT